MQAIDPIERCAQAVRSACRDSGSSGAGSCSQDCANVVVPFYQVPCSCSRVRCCCSSMWCCCINERGLVCQNYIAQSCAQLWADGGSAADSEYIGAPLLRVTRLNLARLTCVRPLSQVPSTTPARRRARASPRRSTGPVRPAPGRLPTPACRPVTRILSPWWRLILWSFGAVCSGRLPGRRHSGVRFV